MINKNEKYLTDINVNTSIDEIKNILSLEHGESICIFIQREDKKTLSKRIYIYIFDKMILNLSEI